MLIPLNVNTMESISTSNHKLSFSSRNSSARNSKFLYDVRKSIHMSIPTSDNWFHQCKSMLIKTIAVYKWCCILRFVNVNPNPSIYSTFALFDLQYTKFQIYRNATTYKWWVEFRWYQPALAVILSVKNFYLNFISSQLDPSFVGCSVSRDLKFWYSIDQMMQTLNIWLDLNMHHHIGNYSIIYKQR